MMESEFLASLSEEEREQIARFCEVRDAIADARSCDWSLLCKIEPWRGCSCRDDASAAIDAWEKANGREPPGFMEE